LTKKEKTMKSLGLIGLFITSLTISSAFAGNTNSFKIVDDTIPKPLTAVAGDAKAGQTVFTNRKLGNCLACHQVTRLNEELFHGEIGPSLDGVADRYSQAELRMLVVNAKQIFPETIMPAFYRTEGLHRVLKGFDGKTVLKAQQVEDLLSFLAELKE